MQISLVLNRAAGTLRGLDADKAAEQIAEIFRGHGHSVSTDVLEGADACEAIERICASKQCDAVVVGGGDGTVSAAASAAARHGMTLGILPLGTMNLFARSLGIPLEMKAAAEALAGGTVTAVDIGDVNGRYFVHVVSIGLHVQMIRAREEMSYSSRLGKMWASLQAWWIVVRQPARLHARIRVDQRKFEQRTAAILVSNNALGEGHLPYADDPRHGTLALYVVKSRRLPDLLRLTFRLALGHFSANPHLDQWLAKEVEITLPQKSVTASVDGEIVKLETPLVCVLHDDGLRVLKPATPAASS